MEQALKKLDLAAMVQALGPKPNNEAYHRAVKQLREAAYKAELYFGCPVKIVDTKQRSGGPGSYIVQFTFTPEGEK